MWDERPGTRLAVSEGMAKTSSVDQIKNALVDQLCDNDSGLAECLPAAVTGCKVDPLFQDGKILLTLADGSRFEISIKRAK